MRVFAFIISGIALVVLWPFAGWMTAFANDQPSVGGRLLAYTWIAVPGVWLASLVVALVIARRRSPAVKTIGPRDNDEQLLAAVVRQKHAKESRDKFLNRCAAAPYIAAGLHVIVWCLLFVFSR